MEPKISWVEFEHIDTNFVELRPFFRRKMIKLLYFIEQNFPERQVD